MNLLDIQGVRTGYGTRVVIDSVDLKISVGERVALIGPNGCGKSTLLRAIVGESVNRTGIVRHSGKDISALTTDRIVGGGIGYLKQSRNIFPGLTVTENLSMARFGCRADGQIRLRRVLEAFPTLGQQCDVRAGLLSGGQRQMLAIAMVVLRPMSLLLLDEPLAGLAQPSAAALLNSLSALQQEDGFGMLIVEHRLRLVQPHVSRVVIMNRGAIVEDTADVTVLSDRVRLEEHFAL